MSAITVTLYIAESLAQGWSGWAGTVVPWMITRDGTIGLTVLMRVEAIDAVVSVLVAVVALKEHPAMEGVVGHSLAPLAKSVVTLQLLAGVRHLPSKLPIADP